jgi:hypothetical protein
MACRPIPYANEQGIFGRHNREFFSKNREFSHRSRELDLGPIF